jgi:hypothetical protein
MQPPLNPSSPTVRARWCAAPLLALLAIACASCATSVTISGHVARPAAVDAETPPVHLEDAIVYVECDGPMLDRWTPTVRRDVEIAFAHGRLEPRSIATTPGVLLHVVNRDSVFHRPFSVSPVAAFDAQALAPGVQRTIALPRPGVVRVFCEHHTEECADVLVLTHSAWTHPDAAGRFTLPTLPRGRYRIHVWHPQLGDHVEAIEIVKPGPIAMDVKF